MKILNGSSIPVRVTKTSNSIYMTVIGFEYNHSSQSYIICKSRDNPLDKNTYFVRYVEDYYNWWEVVFQTNN